MRIDTSSVGKLRRVTILFIALKSFQILVLGLFAGSSNTSIAKISHRWDAQWYRRIAENGYGHVVIAQDGRHLSDYAFFPLYPTLEKLVHLLLKLSYIYSGVIVSVIASLCAGFGIYSVVKLFASERVAFTSVLLWGALPVANVQWLAYSESLFTALAVWALYFSIKKNFISASALAILAGATRPVGIVVAVSVAIPAVIFWKTHRQDISALIAALISPLGWLGYIGWVSIKTGDWKGYLTVTEGWGNGFDGGKSFAIWIFERFTNGEIFSGLAVILSLVIIFYLLKETVSRGAPHPVTIFAVVMVLLSLATSGYFGSKPRYFLPIFPLLLPISVWLDKKAKPVAISILTLFCIASSIYGALWLTGSGPL